jgi:isocitrate lyase
MRLRPTINGDCALARHGAAALWALVNGEDPVIALGALNGSQAVQAVKAGLKAIYLSGCRWQQMPTCLATLIQIKVFILWIACQQ